MAKSIYRGGTRAALGSRIGLGLLMALSSVPGGLIFLRALTLPRGSSGFPDLCPLHRLTGLWCPDLWGALGYNPFALVVEMVAVLLVVRWLLASSRGWRRQFITGRESILLGAGCAAFAVVRNLPGMWVYLGPLLGPPG